MESDRNVLFFYKELILLKTATTSITTKTAKTIEGTKKVSSWLVYGEVKIVSPCEFAM